MTVGQPDPASSTPQGDASAATTQATARPDITTVKRSWMNGVWYAFLQHSSHLLGTAIWGLRVFGRENWPASGGVLVLCNHQSHLDPVLVGLSYPRRMNYLARLTLFRFLPFRLLIQSLDAIPVDRDGMGIAGLKETLRRLKRGEIVLIFPEGTRTRDGEIVPLKPGFSSLAKRSNTPMVPMAIEGAFDIWPRHQWLPLPWGTIHVHIGEPISVAEIARHTDRELVEIAEVRLRELHAQARASRKRAMHA